MKGDIRWIFLLMCYMWVDIQCETNGVITRGRINSSSEVFRNDSIDFSNVLTNNGVITRGSVNTSSEVFGNVSIDFSNVLTNESTNETISTNITIIESHPPLYGIKKQNNSEENIDVSKNSETVDHQISNNQSVNPNGIGMFENIGSSFFGNLYAMPSGGKDGLVQASNHRRMSTDFDYLDDDHETTESNHYGVFHYTLKTVILLEQWTTSHWQSMLWSCGIIVGISILFEGLKSGTERLSRYQKAHAMTVKSSKCCGVFLHFAQTILHVIVFGVSYALMLIFMTFNGYLCMAVLVGNGIGYFIFNYKNSSSFSTDLTSL